MKKLNKLFLKLFVTMAAFSIALLPVSVKAETVNTYFKISFNETYPSFGETGATIFKISETYDEEGLNIKDQYNFYCLKGGVGFGSDRGRNEVVNYTQKFNLKDLDSIGESYRAVLPTDENYNSVMWILDHMFLDGDDASLENYFKAIPELNDETEGGFTWEDYAELGKDRIQIIQQAAIWHFTNPGDTKYDLDGEVLRTYLGDDADDNRVDAFYNWLITGHGSYSTVNISKNDIELNSEGRTIQTLSDGSYKAGPYKVVIPEEKLSAVTNKNNIDISFSDNEGRTVSGIKVVDAEGNTTTVKANTEFYIEIDSDVDVKNVVANLNVEFNQRRMDYYSVGESAIQTNQPLIKVAPSPDSKPLTFEIPIEKFDLALRKYITKINGVEVNISREPVYDVTPFSEGKTTANYNHTKKPLKVAPGDIITYTIRVYNEGEVDGYVSEITDFLPQDLEFIETDDINAEYGWNIDIDADSDGKIIRTNILSKENETESNITLIKAYNKETEKIDYKEVKVVCRVANNPTASKITNIAAITGFTDKNGNAVKDRDSDVGTLPEPAGTKVGEALENYKDDEINREEEYIPGRQDDDDFEKVILKQFDLALRKFIVKIDNKDVDSREPVITDSEKAKLAEGNAKYDNGTTMAKSHSKDKVKVQKGSTVLYKIRVYNEGEIAGYASLVTDYLPEGLTLKENSTINEQNGWVADSQNPQKISTTKLSTKLLNEFDEEEKVCHYADLEVECIVNNKANSDNLKNIAEITECKDKNGDGITDRDSEPGNVNTNPYNPTNPTDGRGEQDDDDFEDLELIEFDLSLRKFITKVNSTEIDSRIPKVDVSELKDGTSTTATYNHPKDPVLVTNGSIVTYTIRVYNEGDIDGYAAVVEDDLPEGIRFIPEHTTNEEYRWVMLDKDGNVTDKVEDAVKITTDYLSKEQSDARIQKGITTVSSLLKAFDRTKEDATLDYRDLKVAFEVTEPNKSERIIINKAQITEDTDKDGDEITDRDSTPGEWIEGEDDQDIEKIKVQWFDLALRKWVTHAIVIENGEERITETGHKAEDDPEDIVKVDLKKSKIKNVTVKFKYSIRVTNEGTIAGYVKEIKDHIPEGLKFVQEDNPEWKQLEENIVVTDQAKDILLKPGESTEVEILLTWINSTENMGLKVNIAEISKDYNEFNAPDIDSTPDNFIPEEDDQDDAPVMLAIQTGEAQKYILITGTVLVILGTGIVLIKKYVM